MLDLEWEEGATQIVEVSLCDKAISCIFGLHLDRISLCLHSRSHSLSSSLDKIDSATLKRLCALRELEMFSIFLLLSSPLFLLFLSLPLLPFPLTVI